MWSCHPFFYRCQLERRMSTFAVRVRTAAAEFAYDAIGTDSAAVHMAAVDRFGVCAITVKPAGAQ
jgi:hypothetical protein